MSLKTNVITAAIFAAAAGISFTANAAPSQDVLLQGVITDTTCDVVANNGSATLDVGVYTAVSFVPSTQNGAVPLEVVLENCSADETGDLLILGTAASTDANIFTTSTADTVGFMIQDSTSAQVPVDGGVTINTTIAGPNTYTFSVGMATTDNPPLAGAYSAPVTVAYLVL
ncbi:fimbrial protein [Serratia microhaemolytica]|uniref:fimbrial protein n=1 Tax=Serratia microhaemolytica TaxID=2675110 RepID=UPI0012D8521B|nr:type 1 fimbrial protein [Serratia microhaemolytica]